MYKLILFATLLMSSLNTNVAYAYIGPGMGGGIIAATLGILIGILAALFGIIYFPIKRYLKRKKEKNEKK